MATLKRYNSLTQSWEKIASGVVNLHNYTENSVEIVSGSSHIFTFNQNTKTNSYIKVSADCNLTFNVNNFGENMVYVENTSANDITLTIASVTINGVSATHYAIQSTSGIEVKAGKVTEIGIVARNDGFVSITDYSNLEII